MWRVGDGEEETTRCNAFVRPCVYFRSRKEREAGLACLAPGAWAVLCAVLCAVLARSSHCAAQSTDLTQVRVRGLTRTRRNEGPCAEPQICRDRPP